MQNNIGTGGLSERGGVDKDAKGWYNNNISYPNYTERCYANGAGKAKSDTVVHVDMR